MLNAFLLQAKANRNVPMAGMTHMQHAQPILLSHFLLAHAEAFARASRKCESRDRKSTRLNSSHQIISYAVFCLKKKKQQHHNRVAHLLGHRLEPPTWKSLTSSPMTSERY